ncbi:hypothetical protein [Romboutsia sp.]|uniref:hypothetical protein n=1 Tax=Romboutsia sp. TaxID=1965302 RepID=UPI003F36A4DD
MKFSFAKVTNSRLMGTLGLIISWEENKDCFFQYFLLDAEGLGIADYVGLENPTPKEIIEEEERLMGGLGSERLYISEEEALFLVKHFGNKNFSYEKPLPGEVEEYIDIIEKYETKLTIYEMYPPICKPVTEEIEFINYMTMRFIAWDRESLRYFSDSEEIANMHITNINGTLLKNNVIEKGNGKYVSEPLFEDEDGYYTCKIAFSIERVEEKLKINSILVTDKSPMYDFEVFDEIAKKEFVAIYDISNKEEFLEKLFEEDPALQKSDMEDSVFFTKFNLDNDHVKENIYVINNDINAIYYQIDDKFFVGTYDSKNNKDLNDRLQDNYKDYLDFENAFYFEQNALYDFVESGSDDFYDFID